MNYYEELGVSRSATTAQIQQAYKALVRILHPDQQQDENLKRLSELQLMRMNEIMRVLIDPVQRREYDLRLDQTFPILPVRLQPAPVENVRRLRVRLDFRPTTGMLVWGVIGVIVGASLILWLRSPGEDDLPGDVGSVETPLPAHPAQDIAAPDKPEPAKKEAAAPRQFQAQRPRERSQIRREEPLPAVNIPAPVSGPQPKPTEEAAVPIRPIPQRAASAEKPAPWTGKWLYAARSEEKMTGLYPPQYIEMQIRSAGGLLHGKYHAVYKVTDRAITPEVAFQFEGQPGEGVSVLPWSSIHGSRGEVRLKALSEESIEVTWITTVFGRSDMLASGKAVLYRSDP